MTVRFIVDAQLPPALAKMLVEFGHEAEHAIDLNFKSVGDPVICFHLNIDSPQSSYQKLKKYETDFSLLPWTPTLNLVKTDSF